ncbi:TPA: hypothetical protein SCV07_001564, partial [Campylobacter lari]|nr:hypothetical protein [Campylobacter lari]
GTIGDGWSGIFIENGGGTIETIDNSGIISGSDSGIRLNNGGKIESINNTGTIQGDNNGIYVIARPDYSATIGNITNDGTIKGNNGIKLDTGIWGGSTTVDNITNKGTIISEGTNPQGFKDVSGGIVIHTYAQAKTIDNKGLILTKSSGIGISGSYGNGKIVETINNSGTIQYNGNGTIGNLSESYGQGAGIYMGNVDGIPKIGTINNSGLINTYNGVYLALGTQVETINNSGTIIASKDGIVLGNNNSKESLQTRVDNITNKGTIQAGRYGIFIDVASNPNVPFQIGKIDIDGLVYGGVAGFYIGENQKLTEDIIVKGTLAGGQAGIINNGIIGDSKNPDKGGIKLQDGGLILASNSMLSDDTI